MKKSVQQLATQLKCITSVVVVVVVAAAAVCSCSGSLHFNSVGARKSIKKD